MKVRTLAIAAVMALVGARTEAAAPDDVQGGTWKIVYSSAEGPEGRALEVLTERVGFHLLRERHLAIPMVLPIEQDGGEPVKGKRDMIVVGRVRENATPRKYLGKDAETLVPKEFNAVPYNNPPFGFSTLCAAELFWNSDDPWEKIMQRARLRALPER